MHAFALPPSFLRAILSSFVAQLLGAVAWLQSQPSLSVRSDRAKPPELRVICASLRRLTALPHNPIPASFLSTPVDPQKEARADDTTVAVTQ